jgi:DNA-binding NarL/FixJ family response regulator
MGHGEPPRLDVTSISERRRGVIGRDAELAAGDRFLDVVGSRQATLFLEGEPGIGKTTIWTEVCASGRARGHLVLTSQPAQSETELPFAGLLDLLASHIDLLPQLPSPQRRALEIALARVDPDPAETVGALATSAGFLSILTLLAAESPVVVAIDDLQWLDAPSLRVVAFGARRLAPHRIGLLGAVRIPSALDPTVPTVDIGVAVDRVRLEPLSLASLYHVIEDRLGLSLPRYALTRIEAASGGNPIVALEIARAFGGAGREPSTTDLPIPETVAGLVSRRVDVLPDATRRALLQCSALARPTAEIVAVGDLEPAVEAGLVTVDADGRIRFAHPLFARAVYSAASLDRRAEVHRWLSERVADRDEQTLHAALASPKRDNRLALRLHQAAERARQKGAPEFAAELEERAAGRTPLGQPDVELERRLRAAGHHVRAGNVERASSLARGVLAASPNPATQAQAHRLIAEIALGSSLPTAIELLETAIRQPDAEPRSVAELELNLAFTLMASVDLARALTHAKRAEQLGEALGDPAFVAEVLGVRIYIEVMKNDLLDRDALRRSLELEDTDRESPIQHRPMLNAAVLDCLSGRLDQARERLLGLRARIIDSGEEHELPFVSNLLAVVELHSGHRTTAFAYVEEAHRTALVVGSDTLLGYAVAVRCLIASLAGDEAAVLADASKASAIFDRVGWGIGRFYVSKALAFLGLSRDDLAEVERQLVPMAAVLGAGLSFGLSAFFVEDLIDARLATGDVEGAERLVSGIEAAALSIDAPIARVIGARGRALVESAQGRHESALETIATIERGDVLPTVPAEHGRTLLAKGQILRRVRRKQAAREALESARGIFDELGMALWVQKTDAELARIGRRRGASLELTETERRIAELAATGLTNRRIAAEAFVSPKTVEDVMSRVYGKLGIRSRAELGARMARPD